MVNAVLILILQKMMETTDRIIKCIGGEIGIDTRWIHQTVKLLEEGGTIPFIARYRKEVTGIEVELGKLQEIRRYLEASQIRVLREINGT